MPDEKLEDFKIPFHPEICQGAGKEKGTTFPPCISASHSLCQSISSPLPGCFFSPFPALPPSSFLPLPLSLLWQCLTHLRKSVSLHLDWLMLSDLDLLLAGRISVLVLSGLAFYLPRSTRASTSSPCLSP